jgi:hypothetical protein
MYMVELKVNMINIHFILQCILLLSDHICGNGSAGPRLRFGPALPLLNAGGGPGHVNPQHICVSSICCDARSAATMLQCLLQLCCDVFCLLQLSVAMSAATMLQCLLQLCCYVCCNYVAMSAVCCNYLLRCLLQLCCNACCNYAAMPAATMLQCLLQLSAAMSAVCCNYLLQCLLQRFGTHCCSGQIHTYQMHAAGYHDALHHPYGIS